MLLKDLLETLDSLQLVDIVHKNDFIKCKSETVKVLKKRFMDYQVVRVVPIYNGQTYLRIYIKKDGN